MLSILRTFAKHVDQGMLPNRFPDVGETPEYNMVDATLLFFEGRSRIPRVYRRSGVCAQRTLTRLR